MVACVPVGSRIPEAARQQACAQASDRRVCAPCRGALEARRRGPHRAARGLLRAVRCAGVCVVRATSPRRGGVSGSCAASPHHGGQRRRPCRLKVQQRDVETRLHPRQKPQRQHVPGRHKHAVLGVFLVRTRCEPVSVSPHLRPGEEDAVSTQPRRNGRSRSPLPDDSPAANDCGAGLEGMQRVGAQRATPGWCPGVQTSSPAQASRSSPRTVSAGLTTASTLDMVSMVEYTWQRQQNPAQHTAAHCSHLGALSKITWCARTLQLSSHKRSVIG